MAVFRSAFPLSVAICAAVCPTSVWAVSPEQAVAKPAVAPFSGETNAAVLGAQMLSRWAPVAEAAGMNMQTWQEQFSTQFALMPLLSLQMMDRVQVQTDVSAKANYEAFAQSFRSALMTWHFRSQSEKTIAKLGSTTTDQVFIPITPCRVVDTRNVGGPVVAGFPRNFNFYASAATYNWASQGGLSGNASTTCPGTVNPNGGAPSAAVATVTVVGPTAAGNFIAWGGATPIPTTSILNWNNPGDIAANTTTIPSGGRTGTGPGGAIEDFAIAYNGPTGQGQVIVDVVGYFVENRATALDCQLVQQTTMAIGAGASLQVFLNTPACPTGYTQTGTECFVNSFLVFMAGDANSCIYHSTDPVARSVTPYARCCRVPGQ